MRSAARALRALSARGGCARLGGGGACAESSTAAATPAGGAHDAPVAPSPPPAPGAPAALAAPKSKYGPSGDWITAGMVLRLRRPHSPSPSLARSRWEEGTLTVSEDATFDEALRVMATHGVGCLVVTDASRRWVTGLLTERTYSRRVVLAGLHASTTRVGDVMKTSIIAADVSDKLARVAATFAGQRIRHLPVVSLPLSAAQPPTPGGGHLALPSPVSALRGVISIKDVAWQLFCLCKSELRGTGIGAIRVADILATRRRAAAARGGGGDEAAFTVPESAHAVDAMALMAATGRHALLVVDAAGGLKGIVTERDWVTKTSHSFTENWRSADGLPVARWMSTDPLAFHPESTLDDVLAAMATFGFRHAPVVPSAGQGGGRPQAAPPPPPPQQQPPAGPLAAAYAAAAAASDEGAEVPRPVPIGLLSIVDVLATIDAWAE